MYEDYDIIVVGAGLVGLSFVAALRRLGLRVAVLETHLPEIVTQQTADQRPLSLAYGSVLILKTMGIWPELAEFSVPVETVHVSEEGRFGGVYFRAQEENVPALGYVVSLDALQRILYQNAASQNGVQFIPIQKLLKIIPGSEGVEALVQTIEGEKTLRAALWIGADGAASSTRRLLGIHADEKQSDEFALTATLQLGKPHQNIAYERFTSDGVLAVLPLKNPQQSRLVWTLKKDTASQTAQWDDETFSRYLQKHFSGRMEGCRIVERGKLLPLQMILAEEQTRPGVVLLGNAAHTIYPIAAQGFNLGLRDAATLAEIVVSAHSEKKSLGNESALASYVEWRRSDQRWIGGLTGGIHQLFDLQIPGARVLRSAGLLAADLMPPLKHRLAKRFMGLSGRLPRLARGIAL